MALNTQIREWIKEAWLEASPNVKLTETDLRVATRKGVEAAEMIYQIRTSRDIPWQQAWSEIAPEVLATPRPSARE